MAENEIAREREETEEEGERNNSLFFLISRFLFSVLSSLSLFVFSFNFSLFFLAFSISFNVTYCCLSLSLSMSNSVYILQYFLLFHSICFNLFMHIISCPSTSPLLYPSIHLPICMSLHHFPSTYRVSPSKVSLFYVIFYFTLCSHCTHVVGTLRCCCLRECCQMVFIICV